jgi:hypothetical protein
LKPLSFLIQELVQLTTDQHSVDQLAKTVLEVLHGHRTSRGGGSIERQPPRKRRNNVPSSTGIDVAVRTFESEEGPDALFKANPTDFMTYRHDFWCGIGRRSDAPIYG